MAGDGWMLCLEPAPSLPLTDLVWNATPLDLGAGPSSGDYDHPFGWLANVVSSDFFAADAFLEQAGTLGMVIQEPQRRLLVDDERFVQARLDSIEHLALGVLSETIRY